MEISHEKNVGKKLASLNINIQNLPEDPTELSRFLFARKSFSNHLSINCGHCSESIVRQSVYSETFALCKNSVVPNKGIASETWGRVSATRFRNTVSDSKMVTPETAVAHLCSMIRSRSSRPFTSGVDEHLLPIRGRRDRRSTAARPFSLSIVDEEKSSGAEPRRVNSFHQ